MTALRHAFLPPVPGARKGEDSKGVAPGMGRKLKVKVLLETRQTESITEDKGGLARGRLVEVVGAARNRAKAKHRKAREPWVSQLPVAKPVVCQTVVCIGDGVRVKLSVPLPGETCRLPWATMVAAEDERTRRR